MYFQTNQNIDLQTENSWNDLWGSSGSAKWNKVKDF